MKTIELCRVDAELIVDLLMTSDHWAAPELEAHIRKTFGMNTHEQELSIKNGEQNK